MIYVHVPFCRSFCTYCDFYSEVLPGPSPHRAVARCLPDRYTAGLCAEIEARREEIAGTLSVNTLYIGGGTPSVLPLECLRRIVDTLGYGPYEEFTVEVNPEDIVEKGPDYVRGLLGLGVNRISMGVQSLDDGILRWMNRRHDSARAREAYRILRSASRSTPPVIPSQPSVILSQPSVILSLPSVILSLPKDLSVSVDLITGVPGMSDEILQNTIDEVIAWRPEHVSAYQLSIEEGSALATMIARGEVREAPEEECRRQYEMLCLLLREAGYHHYEISNWALPGHEAVHNSAYWTRRPYAGLGPGAHSLRIFPDGRQVRSWNSRKVSGWSAEGSEVLSAGEIREEGIMLGLRTDRGAEANGRRVVIPERDWFIADDIIAGMI